MFRKIAQNSANKLVTASLWMVKGKMNRLAPAL